MPGIHRDLKPSDPSCLDRAASVSVADFGLARDPARASSARRVRGSRAAADRGRVRLPTDVYALGMILLKRPVAGRPGRPPMTGRARVPTPPGSRPRRPTLPRTQAQPGAPDGARLAERPACTRATADRCGGARRRLDRRPGSGHGGVGAEFMLPLAVDRRHLCSGIGPRHVRGADRRRPAGRGEPLTLGPRRPACPGGLRVARVDEGRRPLADTPRLAVRIDTWWHTQMELLRPSTSRATARRSGEAARREVLRNKRPGRAAAPGPVGSNTASTSVP